MESWLPAALLALLCYGFWGFFPKLAVGFLNPQSALVFEVGGAVLVGLLGLYLVGFRPDSHPVGILFAVLTGVAGMLGTLFYFLAASRGNIAVVVSVTALYPLITISLAFLLLGEPITGRQLAGMACAILAILLFAF
jgi:bacterial/archaeal transporter family protein